MTEDINYNTSGDFMQATTLMSYIANDADWGEWPNSVYGFIALGVTVEASIGELQIGHSKKQIYLIFLLIHRNLKHFASKLRLFLQRVYFANPQALCLRIPHWLVHFSYP